MIKRLQEQGIQAMDETLIFNAIDKMRNITQEALAVSKTARRHLERKLQADKLNHVETPVLTNIMDNQQAALKILTEEGQAPMNAGSVAINSLGSINPKSYISWAQLGCKCIKLLKNGFISSLFMLAFFQHAMQFNAGNRCLS